MIYFTILIFTLLLSHIALATPACGDVASPKELYNPTYADAQTTQHALPIIVYNVTWSSEYDNPNGSTEQVTCGNGPIPPFYRQFKDFPRFPYIGASWDIVRWGSKSCGACWNLTNLKNNKTISFTAIDQANTGYTLSQKSFIDLKGGKLGSKTLQAEAKVVDRRYCGWKK